jgi:hypothetical protein
MQCDTMSSLGCSIECSASNTETCQEFVDSMGLGDDMFYNQDSNAGDDWTKIDDFGNNNGDDWTAIDDFGSY